MPDLSFVLTSGAGYSNINAESQAWRDTADTFAAGAVPHSWAVRAPLAWHKSILEDMSRLYLCDTGTGCGDCGGCGAWSGGEHPDRIVAGEFEKACGVDVCRALIKELSLKPVAAKRRLGVLLAADKLLMNAANSLLKVAEEPPLHACLLFMMEGSDFLPTLRSRSRFTTFAAPLFSEARPVPANEEEWLEWLESKNDEDIPETLSSWASWLLRAGKTDLAARVEKLRLLVSQKRLSQTMVCDLLILTLKEELPFEPLFGGFR